MGIFPLMTTSCLIIHFVIFSFYFTSVQLVCLEGPAYRTGTFQYWSGNLQYCSGNRSCIPGTNCHRLGPNGILPGKAHIYIMVALAGWYILPILPPIGETFRPFKYQSWGPHAIGCVSDFTPARWMYGSTNLCGVEYGIGVYYYFNISHHAIGPIFNHRTNDEIPCGWTRNYMLIFILGI